MKWRERLNKLINDTLKEQGKDKFSLKRISTAISILMACIVGLIIVLMHETNSMARDVFFGFLVSGFGQGALTVYDKIKNKTDETREEL